MISAGRVFSTALLTLAIASSAMASAPLCENVYGEKTKDLSESPAFPQDPVTLARVKKEIANSKKASDFFMAEMRKESKELKARSQGRVVDVDFLCLGAGPQCAAASLVLGRSGLRAMVLERTNLVAKTFAEKDFFINSIETAELTMHNFPGGVGGLDGHTSQKYAHSSQLAAHIQEQQYASNVPVLLETNMTGARLIASGRETRVEVTTEDGMVIRTKNFVLGTGLGDIGTKVRDEGYRKAFAENLGRFLEHPDALYSVMSTDTFLAALKNARVAGKTLELPESIVIIGDGDGARISIEGMRDANVRIPENFRLTNVGNDFSTPEQYVASRDGDRYIHKIVPFYQAGQVSGIPGHVQSVQFGADGAMKVTAAAKETGAIGEAKGKMIIDSTGYDATAPKLMGMIGANKDMANIQGPLPELGLASTVLARQATMPDGKSVPVYAVGAAAGPLGTREELANSKNKNPIAIYNTVPRTSMFVSNLIGAKPFESHYGARPVRSGTISSAQMIKEAKAKRAEQRRASSPTAQRRAS